MVTLEIQFSNLSSCFSKKINKISIPGGTLNMCRCVVQGHGLTMDLAVLDLQLDSMILKVFSNLYDSMIPRFI